MQFLSLTPITTFLATILLLLAFITPIRSGTVAHGDATFYYPGLGACGSYNTNQDMIVALSWKRFDPGSRSPCGRRIKVRRGDKVVWAICMDKCMGCAKDDVDLSPAAFDKLATESEGRVKVIWRYDDLS